MEMTIDLIDRLSLLNDLNDKFQSIADINAVVVEQSTVEAIPKADYENRLKADLVAMLTELQLEIEENQIIAPQDTFYDKKLDGQFNRGIFKASEIIQEKINALRGNEDDR